jgi:hypothetical protein
MTYVASPVNIRLTRGSHACRSLRRHGFAPKKPKSGEFGYGFGEDLPPPDLPLGLESVLVTARFHNVWKSLRDGARQRRARGLVAWSGRGFPGGGMRYPLTDRGSIRKGERVGVSARDRGSRCSRAIWWTKRQESSIRCFA